jgi:hypothetical protein
MRVSPGITSNRSTPIERDMRPASEPWIEN